MTLPREVKDQKSQEGEYFPQGKMSASRSIGAYMWLKAELHRLFLLFGHFTLHHLYLFQLDLRFSIHLRVNLKDFQALYWSCS